MEKKTKLLVNLGASSGGGGGSGGTTLHLYALKIDSYRIDYLTDAELDLSSNYNASRSFAKDLWDKGVKSGTPLEVFSSTATIDTNNKLKEIADVWATSETAFSYEERQTYWQLDNSTVKVLSVLAGTTGTILYAQSRKIF